MSLKEFCDACHDQEAGFGRCSVHIKKGIVPIMSNFIVHVINGDNHKSMIFSAMARDALDIPGRFANLRHGISLCCALSITDKEREGYEHVALHFGMIQYTCLNRFQLIAVKGVTELPSVPDVPMIAPSRPILPLPHQTYLDSLPWV